MPRPTIAYIPVKDVFDFACTAASSWKPGDVAPISKTRAKAWSRNPYADPDDIALLIAEVGGRCAGYVGLVSARLGLGDDLEKIYWSSALYVAPQYRETGAAVLLIMGAISLGHHIAVFGPSEEASRVFRAAGFFECNPLVYLKCDLTRLNVIGLPFRAARRFVRIFHVKVSVLDKGVDLGKWVTRTLAYPFLRSAARPHAARTAFRRLDTIDDRSFEKHHERNGCLHFHRDATVINWMLAYPWVTANALEGTPGYYFNDLQDHFEYEVFEPPGGGFVVLLHWGREGNRVLRVLDFHFNKTEEAAVLASLAFEHAMAFGADCVILPSQCQAQLSSSALSRSLCKPATRSTFIRLRPGHSRFHDALARISLGYCDGDIPFS